MSNAMTAKARFKQALTIPRPGTDVAAAARMLVARLAGASVAKAA
jgi:hypothetical protein